MSRYEAVSAFGSLKEREEVERAGVFHLKRIDQRKWPVGLQGFENFSYLHGNTRTRWYYSGNQGFGFHHFGGQDASPFDNLVAKSADNKLIRPVESVVSMLTAGDFMGRVTADTDDPADETTAEVANELLRLTWDAALQMDDRSSELAAGGCIMPYGALEVTRGPTWIPIEVEKTRTEIRHDPVLDEDLEVEVPHGTEVEFYPDFQCQYRSYYEITPDPHATSESNMKWVVRTTYEDRDWIKDVFLKADLPGKFYPDAIANVKESARWAESILFWWRRFQDIIPSPQYYFHGDGTVAGDIGKAPPNELMFNVIDVRPTSTFPQGRTLVFVEDSLLYDGPGRSWSRRYPWRWHPYAFWGWFKTPGRFDCTPLLSQIIPHQKKINSIDALVQANRELVSLGQWLIPEHSEVPEGTFSGIPAQEVRYNDMPGHSKPEKIDNPPLPQDLWAERQFMERSIEWIAATGTSDPGVAPSAMRSGAQMQMQNRDRLAAKTPMIRRFQRALVVVAQNVLIDAQLALEAGDPAIRERLAQAMRNLPEAAFGDFATLSVADTHNIDIDLVSQQMLTPEAQAQMAIEFWQFSGGQVTPAERAGILRKLNMDDMVVQQEHASVTYIRRLISRIKDGKIEAPPEGQEASLLRFGIAKAAAMEPILSNFMLTDKFDELDDKPKRLIMQLQRVCAAQAAEEQAQMMQQMMMMQGGGGQAPA